MSHDSSRLGSGEFMISSKNFSENAVTYYLRGLRSVCCVVVQGAMYVKKTLVQIKKTFKTFLNVENLENVKNVDNCMKINLEDQLCFRVTEYDHFQCVARFTKHTYIL